MPGLVGGFGKNKKFLFTKSLYNLLIFQRKKYNQLFKLNIFAWSCILPLKSFFITVIGPKFSNFNIATGIKKKITLPLNTKFDSSFKIKNHTKINFKESYDRCGSLSTNIQLLRTEIGPYLAGLIEGDGTIAV